MDRQWGREISRLLVKFAGYLTVATNGLLLSRQKQGKVYGLEVDSFRRFTPIPTFPHRGGRGFVAPSDVSRKWRETLRMLKFSGYLTVAQKSCPPRLGWEAGF